MRRKVRAGAQGHGACVLALVGLALGYVMAASYAGDRASALLVFLIAFGAVHVPAAFILFLRRARGEGRS